MIWVESASTPLALAVAPRHLSIQAQSRCSNAKAIASLACAQNHGVSYRPLAALRSTTSLRFAIMLLRKSIRSFAAKQQGSIGTFPIRQRQGMWRQHLNELIRCSWHTSERLCLAASPSHSFAAKPKAPMAANAKASHLQVPKYCTLRFIGMSQS